MSDWILGKLTPKKSGNITQLKALILADLRATEKNVGFHSGRLSRGFKLLLLKEMPRPEDFEMHGTTLRSGGRFGNPLQDPEEDKQRRRVHDDIMETLGAAGYGALQAAGLKFASVSGRDRLIKNLPEIRNNRDMTPDVQYPPGGGFLQWDLKKPGLPFLFAAEFSGDGTVRIPGETLQLNSGNLNADYPQRQRLQHYLQTA